LIWKFELGHTMYGQSYALQTVTGG